MNYVNENASTLLCYMCVCLEKIDLSHFNAYIFILTNFVMLIIIGNVIELRGGADYIILLVAKLKVHIKIVTREL